jgi:hypothetical protein
MNDYLEEPENPEEAKDKLETQTEEEFEKINKTLEGEKDEISALKNELKGIACKAGSKVAMGAAAGIQLLGGPSAAVFGWYPGVELTESTEIYQSLPGEAQTAALITTGTLSYGIALGSVYEGSAYAGGTALDLDEKGRKYFEKAREDLQSKD